MEQSKVMYGYDVDLIVWWRTIVALFFKGVGGGTAGEGVDSRIV